MPAAENVNPEQLKMFMTPREILGKYQPLDLDRMPLDPRAGEGTQRAANTAGGENIPINTQQRGQIQRLAQAQPGAVPASLVGATHIRPGHEKETSEQVWSRKAEESKLAPEPYRQIAGGTPAEMPHPQDLMKRGTAPEFDADNPTEKQWQNADQYMDRKYSEWEDSQFDPSQSLFHRIAAEGVQNPVHLGEQFGSEGKPQIVGGHHRLAAAMESRPDDLIPVVHQSDFESAKFGDTGYRYT